MNFVGTPVPEGVWAAGNPSALDYLLRLAQERIELANSGLPGARNQGDAIAMVQRDLAHHHIKVSSALRQKHLKCYGTDDELARMQVEAMNNVLAEVTEISLFWNIHEAVPGVSLDIELNYMRTLSDFFLRGLRRSPTFPPRQRLSSRRLQSRLRSHNWQFVKSLQGSSFPSTFFSIKN